MKRTDKIEKRIREFKVETNAGKDKAVLDSLLSAQAKSECGTPGFIRGIVVKGGIIAAAAGVVIVSAVWLLRMSGGNEISGPASGEETAMARHQSLSELTSVMSLNKAFYSGGMKAVEEQFERVEKKMMPKLRERITIDQLMCELDDCKEIQKRGTL